MRRHPIVRRYRMHTGVDWAAPSGTPIMAAGNAVVEKIGTRAGYGRSITLKHLHGYETTYNHMSGYAKGLKAGEAVVQGQVIGFVGSTGLSTGPHLHFEVLVNGRFVDPHENPRAARARARRPGARRLRAGAPAHRRAPAARGRALHRRVN